MLVATPWLYTDPSVLYLGVAFVYGISFLQKIIADEKCAALMDAILAILHLGLAIAQQSAFPQMLPSDPIFTNEGYHLCGKMQGTALRASHDLHIIVVDGRIFAC